MADIEKKWVKRMGNRFYPYTNTEAVLNPEGSSYENLEERLQNIEENAGDTQGLPKILTVVHFTNDAESNPLPQDAEEGAYAVADGLLFMKTDGGWEIQEDPKYFFFKYDNIMYSYTDGTTQEEFDFDTEHEVEHIPPFIEILDSAATPPPESVASNGYYVYYNQQNVPVIFKYHNGTWTEQTEEILPKAYVVFGSLLFTYEGGQLNANPVPYGNGSSTQIQADWNQSNTSAVDYIKNKPTIPGPQIQADWEETESSEIAYIKNKPTIPAAANDGKLKIKVANNGTASDYVEFTADYDGEDITVDLTEYINRNEISSIIQNSNILHIDDIIATTPESPSQLSRATNGTIVYSSASNSFYLSYSVDAARMYAEKWPNYSTTVKSSDFYMEDNGEPKMDALYYMFTENDNVVSVFV